VNYQAKIKLLLLKSQKENFLKQHCGEDFVEQAIEQFSDILNFDVLNGFHPLEVQARQKLPPCHQLVLLEKRIRQMQAAVYQTAGEKTPEVCDQDGEIDWDRFFEEKLWGKPKAPLVTFPAQGIAQE
jgi:hypothetical protein